MPRPFIPVPNTCKVELLFSVDGQKLENVLNFHFDSTPIIDDAIALCDVILAWWIAYLQPIVAANVQFTGVKVTDLHNETGFQFEYTTGFPVIGTGTGTAEPNHVTLAVRLGTTMRGRNYTGRLYHIGLRGGQVVGNMMDSTALSSIKAAYEELKTVALTAGWLWGVVSYTADKVLRTTGVFTDFASVSVDPTLDSQRRRLPGRGR